MVEENGGSDDYGRLSGSGGSEEVTFDQNGGSSSGNGRPPNPTAGTYKRYLVGDKLGSGSSRKTLVRHPSLVKTKMCDDIVDPVSGIESHDSHFFPVIRSGAFADIGFRTSMEDTYVCVDDFVSDYGLENISDGPNAFYGVFDGHGGKHAADFACYNLLHFIIEDKCFPYDIEKVLPSAFQNTDTAFAEACSLDVELASGTTALTAIVMGRSLVVANAGDCRAVLCRRGKAIEMSKDHKPICSKERKRIEASGGYVYDGYLNGQLNVTRALGDWHMEGMKSGKGGPLSAEPELVTLSLTKEDEFLIMGCDGIWDVFRSQNAVDFARRRLQEHNDPTLCCKDLVDEALKRKSGDNLAAVVVCFQPNPPPNIFAPRSRVHRSFSAEGLRELQSYLDSLGE